MSNDSLKWEVEVWLSSEVLAECGFGRARRESHLICRLSPPNHFSMVPGGDNVTKIRNLITCFS